MMKLQQLIQDMCPNGVEFKKLGEVCNINRGVRVVKSELETQGLYPVYQNSLTPLGYYENFNYPANTTFIISAGAAGKVGYSDVDFWAADDCLCISCPDSLLSKFLYYCMTNKQDYFLSQVRHASVPRMSRNVVENFEIPIPPLEIQKKIVECLDKFSALAAELQAELQMRRKQYEYYRTHLLTPHSESNSADKSDDCNWEWKTIDEIFEIRGGYTPSKSNPAFWEGGTIPWFRMEDIRQNGRILCEAIQHVTPSAVKGKGLFKRDSFLLATTATIGEHALLTVDALANQQLSNLQIRESLRGQLLPKFVFYYMFKVDEFCKAHTNVSGFMSVDMEALRKMPFPIPPLAEQKRIAELLDKFDKLTTSLSEGIPAEQAAQQKRYEYYRDLLLTFPRKEV